MNDNSTIETALVESNLPSNAVTSTSELTQHASEISSAVETVTENFQRQEQVVEVQLEKQVEVIIESNPEIQDYLPLELIPQAEIFVEFQSETVETTEILISESFKKVTCALESFMP